MRGYLAILLVALIAVLVPQSPASATPASADLPIPRDHTKGNWERADPNKPEDQRAREQAKADGDEAACNSANWAACTALGKAFNFGEGRPQNRPVAELLYRKACNAADGEACWRLGDLLEAAQRGDSYEDNVAGRRLDLPLAIQFYARACHLGAFEGCDNQARWIEQGSDWYDGFDPDPAAAEALRRSTCERGGWAACRTLAGALSAQSRSAADQDEGRALIDRQCRAGDPQACEQAADQWRDTVDAPASQMREYQMLGCEVANAVLCAALGRELMLDNARDAGRTAALAAYDRACALQEYYCDEATQIRDEPRLAQACETGDFAACVTVAEYYSSSDERSPLRDSARAQALSVRTCETARETDYIRKACLRAADNLLKAWGDASPPDRLRAESFLARACTAGSDEACGKLAKELRNGNRLTRDLPRATALYASHCETNDGTYDDWGCDGLAELIGDNPATPLVAADAGFMPELTPEEEAAQRAERQRQLAERRAADCTSTTVVFEGQSYSDTICDNVRRMLGGFDVRRGTAPWQALFWRPEVLDRTRLSDDQRVLCGGAVIREGWVLTAAHCLTDVGGLSIAKGGHRIRLGLANPLNPEGYSYPILAAYPHPKFSSKTYVFDIALVQYDPSRAEGGADVQPIRRIQIDRQPLASRTINPNIPAFTYGWGRTALEGGERPDRLRGGRLKLQAPEDCTKVTRFTDAARRDSVLCGVDAGGREGGQACFGDSGGPLITYADADKAPRVIGVVSAGVDCGTTGVPSRYIRVAHPAVQAWLRQTLPPDKSR